MQQAAYWFVTRGCTTSPCLLMHPCARGNHCHGEKHLHNTTFVLVHLIQRLCVLLFTYICLLLNSINVSSQLNTTKTPESWFGHTDIMCISITKQASYCTQERKTSPAGDPYDLQGCLRHTRQPQHYQLRKTQLRASYRRLH